MKTAMQENTCASTDPVSYGVRRQAKRDAALDGSLQRPKPKRRPPKAFGVAAALHKSASVPADNGLPISDRNELAARYRAVRAFSEELCQPLQPEDYVVQSM